MATADSGDVLPHLRTEAIRAVVGPTSADRGFAVAASGAVGRLRYDAATGRLSASVQGTAPSPYRVQVQLQEAYDDAAEDGAGALMEPAGGRCTCPVGTDCKHVAAALYQVVRLDADQALEDAGLKYSDIQPVYLPPADARAAFERGSVDAWVIWDPFQSAAEHQLQARSLRDGSGLVDNHQFYLATRPYAEKNPQVIGVLVEEIRGVGEWVKGNLDEATSQVAPLIGLSPAITRQAVERQGYGARFITPEVIAAQQKIADTFTDLKLIPKRLTIADVIWTPPASVKVAQQ